MYKFQMFPHTVHKTHDMEIMQEEHYESYRNCEKDR